MKWRTECVVMNWLTATLALAVHACFASVPTAELIFGERKIIVPLDHPIRITKITGANLQDLNLPLPHLANILSTVAQERAHPHSLHGGPPRARPYDQSPNIKNSHINLEHNDEQAAITVFRNNNHDRRPNNQYLLSDVHSHPLRTPNDKNYHISDHHRYIYDTPPNIEIRNSEPQLSNTVYTSVQKQLPSNRDYEDSHIQNKKYLELPYTSAMVSPNNGEHSSVHFTQLQSVNRPDAPIFSDDLQVQLKRISYHEQYRSYPSQPTTSSFMQKVRKALSEKPLNSAPVTTMPMAYQLVEELLPQKAIPFKPTITPITPSPLYLNSQLQDTSMNSTQFPKTMIAKLSSHQDSAYLSTVAEQTKGAPNTSTLTGHFIPSKHITLPSTVLPISLLQQSVPVLESATETVTLLPVTNMTPSANTSTDSFKINVDILTSASPNLLLKLKTEIENHKVKMLNGSYRTTPTPSSSTTEVADSGIIVPTIVSPSTEHLTLHDEFVHTTEELQSLSDALQPVLATTVAGYILSLLPEKKTSETELTQSVTDDPITVIKQEVKLATVTNNVNLSSSEQITTLPEKQVKVTYTDRSVPVPNERIKEFLSSTELLSSIDDVQTASTNNLMISLTDDLRSTNNLIWSDLSSTLSPVHVVNFSSQAISVDTKSNLLVYNKAPIEAVNQFKYITSTKSAAKMVSSSEISTSTTTASLSVLDETSDSDDQLTLLPKELIPKNTAQFEPATHVYEVRKQSELFRKKETVIAVSNITASSVKQAILAPGKTRITHSTTPYSEKLQITTESTISESGITTAAITEQMLPFSEKLSLLTDKIKNSSSSSHKNYTIQLTYKTAHTTEPRYYDLISINNDFIPEFVTKIVSDSISADIITTTKPVITYTDTEINSSAADQTSVTAIASANEIHTDSSTTDTVTETSLVMQTDYIQTRYSGSLFDKNSTSSEIPLLAHSTMPSTVTTVTTHLFKHNSTTTDMSLGNFTTMTDIVKKHNHQEGGAAGSAHIGARGVKKLPCARRTSRRKRKNSSGRKASGHSPATSPASTLTPAPPPWHHSATLR